MPKAAQMSFPKQGRSSEKTGQALPNRLKVGWLPEKQDNFTKNMQQGSSQGKANKIVGRTCTHKTVLVLTLPVLSGSTLMKKYAKFTKIDCAVKAARQFCSKSFQVDGSVGPGEFFGAYDFESW